MISEPGSLFPSSWTSKFGVEQGDTTTRVPEGRPLDSLRELPEYQTQAKDMLQGVLKTAVPVFDKSTEDGMHFRIYRMGSLEVRTTQELDCNEAIGAIFSIRDPQLGAVQGNRTEKLHAEQKIVKASEYVERIHLAGAQAGHRRYYAVFETEEGRKILTERFEDGRISWEEDPLRLEERNSLAKVLRSSSACATSTTISDLKRQADALSEEGPSSSSVCKNWVRSTYANVVGEVAKLKMKKDPALVAKRKEEQAKKLAQNQALAERGTSFIPLPRREPVKLATLPSLDRA